MFATTNTPITSTLTSSISLSASSLSSGLSLHNAPNAKTRVLNNGSNKHLLTQSINFLSTDVQKEGFSGENNSFNSKKSTECVYLKLENEALEHIEYLVLEVLDSIILASSSLNDHSPEQTCALIMSNSSSQQVHFYPITNLDEAELRVKQVLPRSYSEDACARAFKKVERCKNVLGSSKKNRFLSKVMNTSSANSLSILTSPQITSNSSDSNNNPTYIFSFPLEKMHNLLVETYQSPKLDIQVTIFLVAILEHITKDILRLSSIYSRHLNQYIINKRDVNISIEGDSKLKKLFFSTSTPQSSDLIFDDSESSDINDEFDDDDDDDFSHVAYVLGPFGPAGPNFFFPNRSLMRHSTMSIVSLPGLARSNDSTISTSNPDECTSDSSTICPESITYENVNLKYYLRVKEFMSELREHLTDLEILRHIFMHLFVKHASDHQSIQSIFGNINDVYDCALRLSELLDDAVSTQQTARQEHESLNQPLLVGHQFWELAEGAEFDVYKTFADTVTDYSALRSSMQKLFAEAAFCKQLDLSAPGLLQIGKYLLPKLLLGPVYYFLYLNETIGVLQQLSFNEDDRAFLGDTLDTLKPAVFSLKDKDFVSSKKRPIETSFRIFQPHQFQPLERHAHSTSSSVSIGQASVGSMATSKAAALAHNICLLNDKKWREVYSSVDSLKLPAHIHQIVSTTQSSSVTKTATLTCSNLRFTYLYEGSVQICKTSQPIQQCGDLRSHVGAQSKLRVSKRYVYLFDGLLILAKKHQTSPLLAANLGSPTRPYRFKESIELDKYVLRDRDDENCFELHVASESAVSSVGQSADKCEHEFVLFIAESASDKYTWMSMLCYSFYKLEIDGLLRDMTNEHKQNNPLPIPPPGYIFDQADSTDTIVFEKANANSCYNSDGLFIKAATLVKLVERLTHHRCVHHKFSATFLMFYRKFTTPRELLTLLWRRFDVPDLNLDLVKDQYNFNSGTITERELLKRYRREYQQPIRLKVINLIKHWLEGYFNEDFANDADLMQSLMQLVEKIGKSYKRFEHVLSKTVQKKKAQYEAQMVQRQMNEDAFAKQSQVDMTNLKNIFKRKISSSSSSNTSLSNVSSRSSSTSTNEDLSGEHDIGDLVYPPVYPPFETHLESTHPYDILTIHPLEFARQATLMEEELFKAIKPNELISLGWNKPEQKFKLSPNVSKLITLSNKFTYWYAKCIVDTQNLEERIAVVHRLLDIAAYFYELNNFSGLKEIYAAFETSFTTRLAITREKSGLEQHRMYEIFKKLFDHHDKGYFERLKKCSPPCIPFIGFHLSIIMKTHEWNKMNVQKQNECIADDQKKLSSSSDSKLDTSESSLSDSSSESSPNLINFSKYRLLVEFVNDLLQYQSVSYKYRVNNNIRAYLLEDIENYFEAAKQELEATPGTPDHSESKKIEDKVDTLLYNKSRQIEPNDINNFPRIRNYALKSPPVRCVAKSNQNASRLNESHRSHSATRVEKKTNVLNTSKQFMAPVYKNSSTRPNGLTSQKASKTINSSVTSYCISREENSSELLYKRSNSSNHNSLKPSDDSISNIFSSSSSPLNNAKNAAFSHSKSASSSSSFQLSHNYEQTNTHGQKLSLSSADSSSSAPNSPPPNYEDVFDSANAVLSYPLITNPAFMHNHKGSKCFDNKTYFHKSSSSSPSLNNELKINGHSSKNENNNQNLVFAFPDFNEGSDNNLKHSIDDVSPIFPMTPSYDRSKVLPPAPSQRPPSPPHQPPVVIRSNLSTGGQHAPSSKLSMPPPIPPRPAKKN
ncbi:son of sevenless -like protein [Brachionus plicatilis]|uniref:Son of sevenless-like protein n=1 Tax=Brachionus plicatilis TaxID=10195 RepID=A0A3M7PN51_BRAPC|nr:son of sevenless -like protein [Brachionus plicatilis]